MGKVPPPPNSYFRIEAILEAPIWAFVLAILLITLAVVSQAVNVF